MEKKRGELIMPNYRTIRYPKYVNLDGIETQGETIMNEPFRFSLTIPFFHEAAQNDRLLHIIMKNPSMADASVCDITAMKVCNNAYNAGYAGVVILNLFPFRATDAKDVYKKYFLNDELYTATMQKNYELIEKLCRDEKVVLAWGTNTIWKNNLFQKEFDSVSERVIDILTHGCAAEVSSNAVDKTGRYPLHPLRWYNTFLVDMMNPDNIIQDSKSFDDKPYYSWIDRQLHPEWNKAHPVVHRNMFGVSAQVACMNNEEDFCIYCRKDHRVCRPNCENCEYFSGSEMGYGIACLWDDYLPDGKDEYIVQFEDRYKEYSRVEESINGPDDF